jgi:hypothetical protein
MPRKEFESFTRLDASDVNTYLMDQSVMTFAGTAARGSAITTPVEGMVTYLNDIDALSVYNGTEFITNRPIMTFAGTAARGSAIPSPVEGMTTYLNDSDSLQIHNGTNFIQALSTNGFTAYTPIITSGSGSFTTVSATGSFKLVGKVCHVMISIVITTNGSAGTVVYATLPTSFPQTGFGTTGVYRENAVTGNSGQIIIIGNASTWLTPTNQYPGGNNYNLIGSFFYEVA